MRKLIARVVGAGTVATAALAATVALATAAGAASSGGVTIIRSTAPSGSDPDTTVTFTVTTGALSLSAPATANLGSGAPGTTISGALGNVTVTDNRALLAASWTTTASSTSFVTGGSTGPEMIPASDAAYAPGTVTTTGTITATPSSITLSGTAQTVVTGTAGVGDNTATWNPTMVVSVPAAAVGGTYTGTLVHSVS
jgi:hypothetical protein